MATVTLRFAGVNNVQDAAVLGRFADPRVPVLTELTEAQNVDLGDRLEVVMREGYARTYTGTPHSGWSTKDHTRAYVVEAGVLKQFFGSTTSALLTLSNNDPAAFAEVNNIVVFSNGTDIGVIDSAGASLFAAPSGRPFKAAMPAGQCVAFYAGRLWVAHGSTLTRSDAYDIEARDERLSDIPLPGRITMTVPVSGGLWVSAGNSTAFLKGGDEAYDNTVPYPALLGSALQGEAEWFGIKGITGEVAVWRSSRGVCLGTSDGAFFNLSEDVVAMKTGVAAAAMLRQAQGKIHYISTARSTAAEFNKFTPDTLDVITTPR